MIIWQSKFPSLTALQQLLEALLEDCLGNLLKAENICIECTDLVDDSCPSMRPRSRRRNTTRKLRIFVIAKGTGIQVIMVLSNHYPDDRSLTLKYFSLLIDDE